MVEPTNHQRDVYRLVVISSSCKWKWFDLRKIKRLIIIIQTFKLQGMFGISERKHGMTNNVAFPEGNMYCISHTVISSTYTAVRSLQCTITLSTRKWYCGLKRQCDSFAHGQSTFLRGNIRRYRSLLLTFWKRYFNQLNHISDQQEPTSFRILIITLQKL